jgi:response regulator NasT
MPTTTNNIEGTTGAPRHILLVDDDELTLDLLSHLLAQAGYVTTRAVSGEMALEIAVRNEPDLALLDVMMPGMSGIDLAARLQAETSVPFMFLSGHGNAETVKRASECGAVGYLLKPFQAAQVMPAIEAALARADEIKKLRRAEVNLTAALAAGRETSIAVGLLMAKCQTDRQTAFEVLRDRARSQRRKLSEVAQELIEAQELINSFKSASSERNRRKDA